MGSYRRAIIVIALPLSRDVCEAIYLAQKPRFLYLDQIRDCRVRRPEVLRLLDHPSCCICSRCYRVDYLGCKIILEYIAPALPEPGILEDPERRGILMNILRRLKNSSTICTLGRLVDSGRLPWGKPVWVFEGPHEGTISPAELMEELRDSVPLSMHNGHGW